MWSIKLFLLTATIHFASTFNYLTPDNSELIYNWNARIQAGTHLPALAYTKCTLNGKIHIQSESNATFVKITDLTYKLYNGEVNSLKESESHELPLPDEVKDLKNPFQIIYNNGQVSGLITEKKEKQFVRNIKRAVASIFQLKEDIVEKEYTTVETSFEEENTLYGRRSVDYTAIPRKNGLLIRKLLQLSDYDIFYPKEPDHFLNCDCPEERQTLIMQNSIQQYTIDKNNNTTTVKFIVATNNIVYFPYNAKSDEQNVLVKQEFRLNEIIPKKEQFHIDEESLNDLTYYKHEVLEDGIVDISNSRRINNYEKTIKKVRKLLEDAIIYLNQDNINTQEIPTERAQIISRIMYLLRKLKIQHFGELQKGLNSQTSTIYYLILPYVGTQASSIHIKNTIINEKVSQRIAIPLLQNMHSKVEFGSEILEKFTDLINLQDTFIKELRDTAILCFGSLVNKAYRYDKKHSDKSEDEILKIYEKYVIEYITKIKNYKNYQDQMVYIWGLYNMKLPILAKHLMPIVKNKENGQHLRFLSLWAIDFTHNLDREFLFENLWSIFVDLSELTELRILSYYIIMVSNPSYSTIRNIYSRLLREPDVEIYNFHWTFLYTMQYSTNPCYKKLANKISKTFNFMAPSRHGVSFVDFSGYSDEKYKFGVGYENYLINTNRSRIFLSAMITHFLNSYDREFEIYVKLYNNQPGGISDSTFTIDSLLVEAILKNDIFNSVKVEGTHIEGAIFKHGQVTKVFYFDKTNKPYIIEELEALKQGLLTTDFQYLAYLDSEILLPTDLGFPLKWEYILPRYVSSKLFGLQQLMKMRIEHRFIMWIHFRHGFTFYNPIADISQGINRIQIFDLSLPVTIEFEPKQEMHFTFLRSNHPVMNIAGLRTHVCQVIFVGGDDNSYKVLIQSSPHSQYARIVGKEKQYRHNYTLLDTDLLNGQKLYMGVYDSTIRVTNGSFKNHLYHLSKFSNKQFRTIKDYFQLITQHLLQYSTILPNQGSYGFILRLEPSQKYNVTHTAIISSIQYISEKTYLSEFPFEYKLSYSIMNGENNLKTWNAEFKLYTSPGHSASNLSLLFASSSGEENYQICMSKQRLWSLESIDETLRIGSVRNNDGICEQNFIEGTIKGKRSEQQINSNYKYKSCDYYIPYTVNSYLTSSCAISHDTVRDYSAKLSTKNIPNYFEKTFRSIVDFFVNLYRPHFTSKNEIEEDIEENSLKVKMIFPVDADEIDLKVLTPKQTYELTGISAKPWRSVFVFPDYLTASIELFDAMQKRDVDYCKISKDIYSFDGKQNKEELSKEWILFAKDENVGNEVYIRKGLQNLPELKIANSKNNQILEVSSLGSNYKVIFDGKEIDSQNELHREWVSLYKFVEEFGKPMVIILRESPIIIEYDKHDVLIITMKKFQYSGYCFKQ